MLPCRIANPGDGCRRGRLSFFLAFAAALLFAHGFAHAQSTLLQGGAWTPGHAPQYIGQGSSQAVVIDGGTAGGGAIGANIGEIGITSRDPQNTYPSANSGAGAFGSHSCLYDAPITNSTGYHFLCFDPNALGGGLISYGAGGIAPQLPLQCNINGVLTDCLGGGGGSTLTVTDGTHTVTGVTTATFSGATVGGSTPNATITIDTPDPFNLAVTDGLTLVTSTNELILNGCAVTGTTLTATITCIPGGVDFGDGVHTILGATSLQFFDGLTIGGASPNANASFNWATTTDIWTSVQHRVIDPAKANQALVPTTYAEFGGTFNIAFTNGINGNLALNHTDCPCSVANPTGVYAGLSGNLTLIQSASGSDIISAWGSTWKFAGGAPPVLSTGANAIDILPFYCRTTTFCAVTIINGVQ